MGKVNVRLNAKGAEKWLNCSGSVILEAEIPEEKICDKHDADVKILGEAKIRLAIKKFTAVKYHKAIKELDISEEMDRLGNGYKDFVMEKFSLAKFKTPNAVIKLGQKLDFSPWGVESSEAADAVIIAEDTMEIIDFDYGNEVIADAKNNSKLKLYALGALTEMDRTNSIKNVTITVYQPRMNNKCSYQTKVQSLVKWGNTKVLPKAKKAASGTEKFCVGKHCDNGLCLARPICRAYANKKLEMVKYGFKQPSALSISEIAHILGQAENLAKWSALVRDFALEQAVNYGVTYPGYKVVEGRSSRVWAADETLIAEKLIAKGYCDDDICPRKLKGITALEKFLSKKTFSDILGDLVVKPIGKPTLAPIEDKRLGLDFMKD
ncbi:MAG: DUF2800 domain-containing protein [Lachnospiraceae bacterium]|nr:DUF2800 domain-containing protein [Lachnospiraceae bacterium]